MTPTGDDERRARRIRTVEEHIRQENLHDLAAVLETFGPSARYEDRPWDDLFEGRDGVRRYYEALATAAPDFHIDVKRRHVAEDAIVLEVVLSGTHTGTWRGLPGTGRRFAFPICAVYTFDEDDKLAGERIYYDRATVLRQLGMFHEPESRLGKVLAPFVHPVTTLRLALRRLGGR